jgi:HEAT repeat protein
LALGETKEDEKSFRTLKEVALDPKQHQQLREAAMVSLAHFEDHDVLPVFVEIAKNDTSQDLQTYAIDCISERDKDKNKTVRLLVDLFNAIPKDRAEQVQTIFYSIAEVGNDKAVDFLATIALGYDDYELRRDAVYYLGNIGGEKARAALYEILRGK